jgi:MinD-like ATPase involved in chromosome partitioning or flagellar assembly
VTPDRTDETPDDGAEHGVLDDSGSLETSSISILGGHIAQVNVDMPVSDEDDVDDDVVEDEMPIIDPESRGFEVVGIVHVPDAGEPPLLTHVPDPEVAAPTRDPELEELHTGDIILEPHDAAEPDDAGAEVHDAEIVPDEGAAEPAGGDAAADPSEATPDENADAAAASPDHDGAGEPSDVDDADDLDAEDRPADPVADEPEPVGEEPEPVAAEHTEPEGADAADGVGTADGAHAADDADEPEHAEPSEPADSIEPPAAAAPEPADDTAVRADDTAVPAAGKFAAPEPAADAAGDLAAPAAEQATAPEGTDTPEPADAVEPGSAARPAAAPEPAAASAPESAPATGPVPRTRAERATTGVIGTVPLTRREVHQADEAARASRVHATERVRTPGTDVTLTSKRLGEIDDSRESPDLLTADRLLDPRQISRPEPEGLWQQLVYSVSRHRINLGDGRRARARKDLDRRIATPLPGDARFVPVLSRKGGVGKTTVTSLLGMALADARDDRVIAVDANPDRGTLADRVGRPNGRTVRDLVRAHDEMEGYSDVSSIVARDTTRLDVLASDSDPRVSEAFSDEDYRRVADVAAHYYSIVLTDTGTGIVHSVMEATLELSDSLVVVAGLSVDEARLASETLTWLETNGYADRVRNAVVVLNTARPGAPLVRESELEAHFRTRVRAIIRMPYDAHVAAGSAIVFRDLQPATRQAARELAAAVVEGLRTPAAVA